MSFGLYVLILILLYVLIVHISVWFNSTVVVLMIYKDGVSIGSFPFYSAEFGFYLRRNRENAGVSMWEFAQEFGLSWMQVFLMERGLKISSDVLIEFLKDYGMIEKWWGEEDVYVVSSGSLFMEWCQEACNMVALSYMKDIPEEQRTKKPFSRPVVYVAPESSFDEYIFKGKPVLYFSTTMDPLGEETETEGVDRQKNGD